MSSGLKASLLLLTGAFAFGFSASAQFTATSTTKIDESERPRKWKGEWSFELAGHQFEEGKDEGATALLYFKTRFDYQFTSWLKARVSPRLDLFTSRVQERYDSDTYQNRVRLLEGYLSVQPIEIVELRAGAINQGYLGNPMLVSNHRSFPGFQEIYKQSFGEFTVEAAAQQVVPTSSSLNTEREDRESLPSFQTQTLKINGAHFGLIEWGALAGHYEWANLPDKIAFESAVVGNRVEGEVAPGSRFLSGFNGYLWGADLCSCPVGGWLKLNAEYRGMTNLEAPSAYADAQLWGFGPAFVMGDLELDIRYRSYFIERDATVAVYNRSLFGHTNRVGDSVEFELEFKDQGFSIVGEWINARTARNVETQKTMTSWYLGVETEYVSF